MAPFPSAIGGEVPDHDLRRRVRSIADAAILKQRFARLLKRALDIGADAVSEYVIEHQESRPAEWEFFPDADEHQVAEIALTEAGFGDVAESYEVIAECVRRGRYNALWSAESPQTARRIQARTRAFEGHYGAEGSAADETQDPLQIEPGLGPPPTTYRIPLDQPPRTISAPMINSSALWRAPIGRTTHGPRPVHRRGSRRVTGSSTTSSGEDDPDPDEPPGGRLPNLLALAGAA
jgi:hypothetical protein